MGRDEEYIEELGSLPARGVRVEISPSSMYDKPLCYSPQGECGLKSPLVIRVQRHLLSLPARGVRVEILSTCDGPLVDPGHSPQGECGLKYAEPGALEDMGQSLPTRGVRVEMALREIKR